MPLSIMEAVLPQTFSKWAAGAFHISCCNSSFLLVLMHFMVIKCHHSLNVFLFANITMITGNLRFETCERARLDLAKRAQSVNLLLTQQILGVPICVLIYECISIVCTASKFLNIHSINHLTNRYWLSLLLWTIFSDAKTHLRPSTFCHEPELYSVTEPNRVLSQEMNVPVNPASAAAVCVQESTRTLRDGGTWSRGSLCYQYFSL